MKKILRIQCLKLFHSADYVGFNLIGSLVVILFGWAVLMSGQQITEWGTMMNLSISRSFPALLLYCTCIFSYTFAKEYQNKTIYYEKMHEIGDRTMILGRVIVPIMNTCVFVLTVLAVEVVTGYIGGYCDFSFIKNLALKLLLTCVCVLHLNIIIGLYFIGIGNVLASSMLVILIQWCGSIFFKRTSIIKERNFLCANQFSSIWEGKLSYPLFLEIIVSFCLEVFAVFLVVCFWNRRKDWK